MSDISVAPSGAPSRVPPPASAGRPFCLPSPTGGRTPTPAQPPPDSASSCGPTRVSPPSFPRCHAQSWRPSTPQTRSPDARASAGTTTARTGRCGRESPLRLRSSGAAPPPAWPRKRSQTIAWSIRTNWTSLHIPAPPGQDIRATGRRHRTSCFD